MDAALTKERPSCPPLSIRAVTTAEEIATVAELAQAIWTLHFTPLIGAAQVAYMLEHFQSVPALTQQIASGWEYSLAELDQQAVGYTALIPERAQQRLMVSKLYVQQAVRGQGVGTALLQFIEQRALADSMTTLWLTVNRFNTESIEWYRRRGFQRVQAVKLPIGNGFYQDDDQMEKRLHWGASTIPTPQ